MEKELARHVFSFNPKDNGGEALLLVTTFYDNGDGIYLQQELSLHSYCNTASFNLLGVALTAKSLRQLANELDEIEAKCRGSILKEAK